MASIPVIIERIYRNQTVIASLKFKQNFEHFEIDWPQNLGISEIYSLRKTRLLKDSAW